MVEVQNSQAGVLLVALSVGSINISNFFKEIFLKNA